jgi:hypothetical protein
LSGKSIRDSTGSQGDPLLESTAPVKLRIVTDEDIWFPKWGEYLVRGRVKQEDKIILNSSDYLYEPAVANLAKRNIVGAHAIFKMTDRYCPVRLMYCGNLPLRLYSGTELGVVEEINMSKRVCRVMDAAKHTPTDEYLEKAFAEDLMSLPHEDQKRLKNILTEFADVFSKSKFDIGLAQAEEHRIDTGDAQPIASNPRRVPIGVEEKVDQLVEQLLQHNIIRPSSSAWNSPIVVVSKKNGDIRMCIDYRRLNSVTKRPIFPIPDAQQLFDTLDGSCYFSTLDLSQGYHQVPVAESDIPKTAFTTRRGQYEFLRMPFGLCSAPATFQRVMHKVLRHENWLQCLIYLDDVLIFGKNAEEHEERLRQVLQRIRQAGLKLSSEKCHLFKKEVSYLGHIISHKGIETSNEKIEKVENFKVPSNEDELRSFLGLCGYYRRFIKDFAKIVAPLEKLCITKWNKKAQKKPQPTTNWHWTEEHENSFKHLKWCLTHAPILAFPTREDRFILDTDASHDCIGAVLSQIQNGEEHVIAYASNRLTKCERNYCITRKELLAIYKYVLYFKHYLYGRKFTVRTDHQALTWLLNWKRPNTSQYCSWRAELECYDMEVVFRPGHEHANADALSRLPQCEQCEIMHEDPKKKRNFKVLSESEVKEPERIICRLSNLSCDWRQEDDPDIKLIMLLMAAGKLNEHYPVELQGASNVARLIWQRRKQLRRRGEQLYLLLENKKYVLIVPEQKRASLIMTTHCSLGHIGISKTLSILKDSYYWPNMAAEVRIRLNTCKACAERKCGNTGLQPTPLKSITGFPFEKIAMDITGPLPMTKNGVSYILAIVDYFSKYPMLIPIRNVEAATVAEAVFRRWISVFGVPYSIHSDRGTCFESSLFYELCHLMNIQKTRTAPYYPKSDGLVERLFRTVKDMVHATMQTNKKEWDQTLPLIEIGLRASIQSSTRLSPHEIIFGQKMRLPIVWNTPKNCKHSVPKFRSERVFYSQFVLDLKKNLEKTRQLCIDHPKEPVFQQHDKVKPFLTGTTVMARIFPNKKGIRERRYDGPYKIIGNLGKWTYRIEHVDNGTRIIRNHHHLKACPGRLVDFNLHNGENHIALSHPREQQEQQQLILRRPARLRMAPTRYGFSKRGEV